MTPPRTYHSWIKTSQTITHKSTSHTFSTNPHNQQPVSTIASKVNKANMAPSSKLSTYKMNPKPKQSTLNSISEWWKDGSRKPWTNSHIAKTSIWIKNLARIQKIRKSEKNICTNQDIVMLASDHEEKMESFLQVINLLMCSSSIKWEIPIEEEARKKAKECWEPNTATVISECFVIFENEVSRVNRS